ncbi:MAG: tRNA-intron lyase [Euryarchaeota archaeon]|nr:tRNA-intron lyase [Euryarchaeota archaeon]
MDDREVPTGILADDRVVVRDPPSASLIYNKGYFGANLSGGSLSLDLIEATYLVEAMRLVVMSKDERLGMKGLFKVATRIHPSFEIKYLVYRDLRQRGYVVKAGAVPVDFRVLPRGGVPSKAASKFWVVALSERGVFDIEELLGLMEKVEQVRKTLLLAVVDEEGDLTYYNVKGVRPHGRLKEAPLPEVEGILLQDRSLILDPLEAQALYNAGFYGKPMGSALQLSLLESVYLMDKGALRLRNAKTNRVVPFDKLFSEAVRLQPDFELRLSTYRDLRAKGILVKTGFKYGSHFRAYEGDPDKNHARYLVHAVPEGYRSMWAEISRAVRLAHGVKKEILLARTKGDEAEYVRLGRMRP